MALKVECLPSKLKILGLVPTTGWGRGAERKERKSLHVVNSIFLAVLGFKLRPHVC
jgi:hypothetical protein